MQTQIENYDEGKSVARYCFALITTMLMFLISFFEIKPSDFSRIPILFIWKLGMCLPFFLFIIYVTKAIIEEIKEHEEDYNANAEVLFPFVLISLILVIVSLFFVYGSLTWLQGHHGISSFFGILGWSGFLLSKMQPIKY